MKGCGPRLEFKVLDDYEEEVTEVVGGKELLKWPSDLEATVMHSDIEVAQGRRQFGMERETMIKNLICLPFL